MGYFLGIVVGLLIALLLAGGALYVASTRKPDTFEIRRRLTIPATSATLYPYLIDLREWEKWSPWEGIDPLLTRTYEGPEVGVGAAYTWSGNRKAGAGKMEIVDVDEGKSVDIKLDFFKPMKAQNQTSLSLNPSGDETEVVWTMTGENNALSKMMSVFKDMDSLVGPDFERGLSNLSAVVDEATN